MDNRSSINNLFGNIADQLGFQVVLGDNNLCNIKSKSTGEEYIVELPNNGDILYIYSAITDVPFDHRESIFEYILRINLHGIETSRCIIGIDGRTNKFILSRPLPIDGLNETMLLNAMNDFFAILPTIREGIEQHLQAQISGNNAAHQAPTIPGNTLSGNFNFIA